MIFCQLLATASLTASLVSHGHPGIDRETFGIRYRTPAIERFTAQVGLLTTSENGIIHPSEGAGIRHWAVGGEYLLRPWWRASLIYGNFDELRPHDSPLPFTYYRFGAVGSTFQLGATALTIEKVFSAMHQTHAAIHDIELQAHSVWWDVMASSVHGSPDQAPYHFLTAEATVRPLVRLPAPFCYLGVEGGTRALPSLTHDTESLVTFVSVGLFLSFASHSHSGDSTRAR